MVIKKHVLSLITLSVALALGGVSAFAADSTTGTTTTTTTTTTPKPATKLVTTYSTFAGSDANATALVKGLRAGTSITLTSGSSTTGTTTGTTSTSTTTFTPATSKLGYGNINLALALAQAELTKLGITNPTPAQLQAAFNGGSVTTSTGTTTLSGILKLRSEGMGWGVIAKSLGFKLGAVVSASKTDKSAAGTDRQASTDIGKSLTKVDKTSIAREGKIERVAKAERPEKVERPQRVERPEKVERPERVERPEKVERPERVERPEKVDRPKQ